LRYGFDKIFEENQKVLDKFLASNDTNQLFALGQAFFCRINITQAPNKKLFELTNKIYRKLNSISNKPLAKSFFDVRSYHSIIENDNTKLKHYIETVEFQYGLVRACNFLLVVDYSEATIDYVVKQVNSFIARMKERNKIEKNEIERLLNYCRSLEAER
jgi:hypothetical protein